MPITRIAGAKAGGLNGATISAINITGATLGVMAVSNDNGVSDTPTFSDGGNTWTPLTAEATTNCRTRLWYCINPAGGAGYTIGSSQTGSAMAIAVQFFGGGTFTYERESAGANASGVTTVNTGSTTPSFNGSLIVSNWCNASGVPTGLSINTGFTLDQWQSYTGGSNYGAAIASLDQTTAAAVNPSWSWGGSFDAAAVAAVFQFTASGGATIGGPVLQGRVLTPGRIFGGSTLYRQMTAALRRREVFA